MLVLDEELLACDVLDLLLSELPAAIIRLQLLARDGLHYTSSLVLLQELVNGAPRPMDHCRNLGNRETNFAKLEDLLLRDIQHSQEDPWLLDLLCSLKDNLRLRLTQEPEKLITSLLSSSRIHGLDDTKLLKSSLLHVADKFEYL